MKSLLKRYKVFLILVAINVVICFSNPTMGQKSINITLDNAVGMLAVFPPIFILLGLLDVWVERETMIKLMGEGSGILGISLAFILGSAAVGPLYGAFPVAVVMLKKGCKLSNIFIFIGAWSTTKIPLLLFEASAMGWPFMLTRFVLNLPVIILIAVIIQNVLTEIDKRNIYEQAKHF